MMFFSLLKRSRLSRSLLHIVLGLGLTLFLAWVTVPGSVAIPISEVSNPRQNNGAWVSDMADMLSPSSEDHLNVMFSQLEAINGSEIAVVTVPNTQPSSTPKAFATELFNQWGLGKKGIDNGLLFLVSKGDRRTEIETGYAIEAVLPDAKVGEILRSYVTPQFKAGDFDAGIVSGTEKIVALLKTETFAPPTPLELVGRYSGWIFNGVMLLISAGIATLALKGAKKEIRLSPFGNTQAQPVEGFGKFC